MPCLTDILALHARWIKCQAASMKVFCSECRKVFVADAKKENRVFANPVLQFATANK
jgi:hypothetical protein